MRLLQTLMLLFVPMSAAGQNLVICNIGGPGTTAQAQPVVDKFLRHIEKVGGIAKGGMQGEYHNTVEACDAYIESKRPLFAVLDLATYLARQKKLKLKPLGCLGKPDGERYHLLVREGTYKTLAQLKGKKLMSSHLGDLTFVSKIIFDGQVDASKHFELKATGRPLKGLRKVAKGRVDATLVNQMAYEHLSELDLGTKLVAIHQSRALPGLTLAVIGTAGANNSAVAKVKKTLNNLCKGAGKSLCNTFRVATFAHVSSARYERLAKAYR